MPVRQPINLDDAELMGVLRSVNDADFAGQWGRSDASCAGVGKMLEEASRRRLPIAEFTEIADLMPGADQPDTASPSI